MQKFHFYLTDYITRNSKTVGIGYIYVGCPKKSRTCEQASQRARAARLRWWRFLAGTLSFIVKVAAACRVSWSSDYMLLI